MLKKVSKWLIDNWILTLPVLGLIVVTLLNKKPPTVSMDGWTIVYLLFVFFVIIKGMERSGLIRWGAALMGKGRLAQVKLILLSAGISMFITHDLALITLVPLTMAMDIDDKELMVILETLAATGAAALTPFGNPQNLFMYYFYKMPILNFIKVIAPLVITVLAIVIALSLRIKTNHKRTKIEKPTLHAWVYLTLFALFILVMVKAIPIWVSLLPLAYAALVDRKTFKVDYILLMSFLAFFALSNGMLELIRGISVSHVFWYTIVMSQAISNLPPVLLFAKLTTNWQVLLWASSIGAFGSIIGSLASLISYRMYLEEMRNGGASEKEIERLSWHYLKRYHVYSFGIMAILLVLYFVIF